MSLPARLVLVVTLFAIAAWFSTPTIALYGFIAGIGAVGGMILIEILGI